MYGAFDGLLIHRKGSFFIKAGSILPAFLCSMDMFLAGCHYRKLEFFRKLSYFLAESLIFSE
jgi:hypothetical protein